MRRGAIARAAMAAAAICGLAACSATLGGSDDTGDAGLPEAASASPGRHSGLPEPCGTVDPETLTELLPAGEAGIPPGEPAVTYDTGRRVGCEWNTVDEAGTHQLAVDYQRIVSYDPAISDDEEAEAEFEERAAEAGISISAADSPGGSATDPEEEIDPRAVDGIGHVAYIDDALTSDDTGERREVTLAFRNANVIVTVNYTVSTTTAADAPDSATQQQRAQAVARQLASGLEDD